ncbi:hypothetical protein K435DRAFT_569572, partial [Dendrothele bispora CBS 962.96]
IMQNTNFKQHLILFCIDEAHLIQRWAPNFRPAFNDIGALARGYLSETMPILALTATCAPGQATTALSSKYSQLLDYLRCGRKTVIHVQTFPIAYDIYEFLWDYIPKDKSPLRRMRMYHALCTDEYNRETFGLVDSYPELQIVIATVGFSQGINCKMILDSISWSFPSTLDEFVQAQGRNGR